MSRFTLIALVVGVIGITSAAALWFLPGGGGHRPYLSSEDQRQKARDFFEPAPKRDLRSGQEMRPRW